MSTEYKLSYTADEINEKLGKVDNLSWNDLTEKPFGKEKTLANVLEWDGQKGDCEWIDVNGNNFMVKVSDEPMTLEQLNSIKLSFEAVGMVNGISEGETGVTNFTISDGSSKGIPLQLVRYKNAYFVHNAQEDCVLSGITYTKGIWFFCTVYNETNYIYPTSIEHEDKIFEIPVKNTIPKEYLPSIEEQLSEVSEVEVLAETTLESDSNAVMLPYKLDIEIDKTYKIMWNGTEYICKAGGQMSDGNGVIVLGNQMELTGVDDGIPFCVAWVSDSPNETAVVVMDGSASSGMNVVISIVSESTTYTKLPEEVLPLKQSDWNEEDETSPAYIHNKPESLGGGVTWFSFDFDNISAAYQKATDSNILTRGRQSTSSGNNVTDILEVLDAFDNGIVRFQICAITGGGMWNTSVATMLGYSMYKESNPIYEISFSYVDYTGGIKIGQMCINGNSVHEPLKVSTSTSTNTTTTSTTTSTSTTTTSTSV